SALRPASRGGAVMPDLRARSRLLAASLCIAAVSTLVDAPAFAGKIKMVFPGPVTTFSLPYLVAQKKGWLGDLAVEDVHVTGDANAMRVLLSGNADIGLIGTLNVLASIHAGAGVRAIHSWQPIGDYSLVLAKGKGDKLADLAGKTFAASGPGGLPDQLPRLLMRKHAISEQTFYNWKAKFGGLEVSEAKRLKGLESENAKLKRLLADAMLDNAALKDLLTKKW